MASGILILMILYYIHYLVTVVLESILVGKYLILLVLLNSAILYTC